ncbi:ATP12 family protein [Acuticoccus sp. MNP-M23]|uniref:ATP12 family chaperone protein n=1 Tax=Acuticoccus sp. MNP-M23 TaxID=3072793 RepID=UPI002815E620|nr:ATP12 family protein [Acuticoccus sp. MNP-M23]WMS40873.1 ATP12 family protein [Acuticoccus sp. MNP-M23]
MSDEPKNGAGRKGPDVPEPLKRFYTDVSLREEDDGHALILLDGRTLRTPARAQLKMRTPIASAMAAEWDAQQTHILPLTMPVTRLVNTAIDGVAAAVASVQDDLVAIAGNDLIVYRADRPDGLVARQNAAWDPVVRHTEARFGTTLRLTAGVMPINQDEGLARAVKASLPDDPLRLAALHQLSTLTGSALIALAVAAEALDLEAAWEAAHVDEDWNIDQWGADAQAAARRNDRKKDADAAAFILREA